jgi:hypothetical protein
MKKTFNFLIFVLIIGLFSSCEKDEKNSDDNNLRENFLKYGTEQVLISAEIDPDCFGTVEDGPMFKDVIFYSSGVNISEETGIGSAIYLNLYNNECITDDGTYTYSYGNYLEGDGTFDADFIWDGNLDEMDLWIDDFTSGDLTLIKNGYNYEIEFSCLSSENKYLSGYFKGDL